MMLLSLCSKNSRLLSLSQLSSPPSTQARSHDNKYATVTSKHDLDQADIGVVLVKLLDHGLCQVPKLGLSKMSLPSVQLVAHRDPGPTDIVWREQRTPPQLRWY